MASNKLTLMVCRSCVRDNPQTDPALSNEENLRALYRKKIKSCFFRKIANLQIVDCLTNCQNPNSVQINRDGEEMLLGRILSETQVDEVIDLVKKLRNPEEPLQPSESLKPCLVFVHSRQSSDPGQRFIRADRVTLG